MKTIALGNTGVQVSQLALGCMIMGPVTDEPTAMEMLDRYHDAGGNFLDTANGYMWWAKPPGSLGGESESLLGRWMQQRHVKRDDIFLATKGGGMVWDQTGLWDDGAVDWGVAINRVEGAGAATLRKAIEDSLRRLGTDYVDLYYVHVDDTATPLEETLSTLASFVAEGKTRYIGWSNVRTWRLERIRQLCARHGWPAPVAAQQHHTYLRHRAGVDDSAIVDGEQLDYLHRHDDITLVAYSPILKGIYDSADKREGHSAMGAYRGPDADARLAVVAGMAAELGCTPNQLVLAWMMHSSPARVALVGPRTLEQYEAAMGALEVKLTDEQMARLDSAGA